MRWSERQPPVAPLSPQYCQNKILDVFDLSGVFPANDSLEQSDPQGQ